MRKFSRAGGAAAGALALALTAGAFAVTPAAAARQAAAAGSAAAAASKPPPLTSIQPGHPVAVTRGRPAAPNFVTNALKTTASSNWAGYVAARSGITFNSVTAHFFVPVLDCTGVTASNPTYSSHWVGLDGFVSGSNSVEQTGLLAACYPDSSNQITPVYETWYEKYPNPPVYSTITVRPGDALTATVSFSTSTKAFTFAVSDATNGQKFSIAGKCPVSVKCARSSAEVISEAPSNGTNVLPLADFQAASYSGTGLVSSTGTKGGLTATAWDTYKITQVSDGTNLDAGGNAITAGTPLDTPTPLLSGNTFSAYWMPGT